MKSLLLALLMVPVLAFGQAGVKLEKLVTRERYEFGKVEVMEKVPDGIYIRYESAAAAGGADTFLANGPTITKIPYESLSEADKRKLGGFTAPEARRYRKAMAEKEDAGEIHPLEEGEEFFAYDPKKERELVRGSGKAKEK